MMSLPGPLELPWAEVVSAHCVGSYWAPGFSNYLLLFQVRSQSLILFTENGAAFKIAQNIFNIK